MYKTNIAGKISISYKWNTPTLELFFISRDFFKEIYLAFKLNEITDILHLFNISKQGREAKLFEIIKKKTIKSTKDRQTERVSYGEDFQI